jgi:DNA-binding NarL/FixJ family response regulator
MTNIKVLLADDHSIVLDGLRLILEIDPTMEVVGEARNGQEVLDFIESHSVDVIIMDINMPTMDGITCSRKIKLLNPDIKIIVLTMYPQKSFVDDIVKIGIDGCLLKSNTGKELTEAIRRVQSGKPYYDQIRSFDSKEEAIRKHKLTDREVEIIRALADGQTSDQIATELFISEHTVRTHRKNILKKLDLHNSSELVQYALSNGII